MPDPYPTFDRCPRCDALIWSDGTALWCRECDWSAEQGRLFDNRGIAD
jgi:hypothetical protein